MLSKEEIEKIKELSHYCALKNIDREDNTFGEFVVIIQKARNYIEQIETENKKLKEDKKELIELNNKYLQKLVYVLSPTKHTLGDDYNTNFKKIIAENIDLETCKIKQKLKECWGIDKF